MPPISVVLANGRDRCIAALTAYREDEVNGWIEHFAAATTTAANLASGYLRYVTLGRSVVGRILLIVHTESDERIRIISARRPTRAECRRYEEGQSP